MDMSTAGVCLTAFCASPRLAGRCWPAARRGVVALAGLVLAVSVGRAQEGLTVQAVGTGRTTGHIATLEVSNRADVAQTFSAGPALIPASGTYQPYIVSSVVRAEVPAGATLQVPVTGYCADIHRAPVPAGATMPPPSEWVSAGPSPGAAQIVIRPGGVYCPAPSATTGAPVATLPGTDTPLRFTVDLGSHPEAAAALLIPAASAIEETYLRLAKEGRIHTPFSADAEKEREAVIQQTFWIYAAALDGRPYTKQDFEGRLTAQYTQSTGKPIDQAPPAVKESIEKGAADFWATFALVGAEAKVLAKDTPRAATPETTTPETTTPPAVAVATTGCTPEKKIEHSPRQANAVVADSYGSEEDRAAIVKAIQDDVNSPESAYQTGTPPATAFAIWRDDHVGGNASAYAKTVFLKRGDNDWVWSTAPLSVSANGKGTHTLSFAHGQECTAVVVGVGLMRQRASSEAFDPLANSIEVFRVLDTIKDLSVDLALKRAPAGLSDAIEAGVDAATDPASDTYAVATGACTLTVGSKAGAGGARSRVDYKRADTESKAITGGAADVKEVLVSDVQPDSLTSTVEASVTMEAGASGNGYAKALLESLYATLLVGWCDCPGGARFEMLSDLSLFMKDEAVAGYVKTAQDDLQKVLDGLGADIDAGKVELNDKDIRERLEKGLRGWADGAGGGRFRQGPADPAK